MANEEAAAENGSAYQLDGPGVTERKVAIAKWGGADVGGPTCLMEC